MMTPLYTLSALKVTGSRGVGKDLPLDWEQKEAFLEEMPVKALAKW